jgi:hypothetical protein
MSDEEFYEKEINFEEDEEYLSEEKLNSLDPWEIAFEEGVKMAEERDSEEEDL